MKLAVVVCLLQMTFVNYFVLCSTELVENMQLEMRDSQGRAKTHLAGNSTAGSMAGMVHDE